MNVGLVFTFLCTLFVGYGITSSLAIKDSHPSCEPSSLNFDQKLINSRSYLYLLLALLSLGLIPWFSNGIDGFILKVLTMRGDGYSQFSKSGLGGSFNLSVLTFATIACTSLSLLPLLNRSKYATKKSLLLYSFCFLFLIILVISTGGRTQFIGIIIPVLLYTILTSKKKIWRLKTLCIAGVIFSLVALTLSLMVLYRRGGILDALEKESSDKATSGLELNREIITIISRFEHNPIASKNTLEHMYRPILDTSISFITNPIPRNLWENKYLDPSFSIYNTLRNGKSGFGRSSNVTPTVIGRFYMLYGISGVIQIGLVIGMLLGIIDRKLKSYISSKQYISIFIAYNYAFFLFQSVRDLYPGRIYIPLIISAFFYILRRIHKYKQHPLKITK